MTTLKHLTFWFDPISPFAYLAFERLPQALEGLSIEVSYRPVLFAALLNHWGQKGPAEIEPKRAWTFRHVHWLAHHHGIEIATPAQHQGRQRERAQPVGPAGKVAEAIPRGAVQHQQQAAGQTDQQQGFDDAPGGAQERLAALAQQTAMREPEGTKQQGKQGEREHDMEKQIPACQGPDRGQRLPQQQAGEKHQVEGALGGLMVVGQPLPALSG